MGFGATKLWNTAVYQSRQMWESSGRIPTDVELQKQLQGTYWYRNHHSDTATAILQQVWEAHRSWFRLRRTDPTAHPPGFRPKTASSAVPFKTRGFRVNPQGSAARNGVVRLSVGRGLKAHLAECGLADELNDGFLQVRYRTYRPLEGNGRTLDLVRDDEGRWWANVVVELPHPPRRQGPNVVSVDRGIVNLAATVDRNGQATVYATREIQSTVRYFSKRIAQLQEARQRNLNRYARKRGIPLAQVKWRGTSRTERALWRKRNRQINQMLHIVSKAIVRDAVENNCSILVDGDTRGLKKQPDGQGKDFGKRVNQKLFQVPLQRLAQQLRYKSERAGLAYESRSERGTSRTCCRCGRREAYKGQLRQKRGLFVCPACGTLNADVNGAANHLYRYLRDEAIVRSSGAPRKERGQLTAPAVVRLRGMTRGFLVVRPSLQSASRSSSTAA